MINNNFIIYATEQIKVEEQIKNILNDLDINTDIEYYDLKEDGISQILGVLNTPNFLNENKCVCVKKAEDIFNLDKKYYNYFIKYLTNPASFSFLILWFTNIKDEKISDIKKLCIYYDLNNKVTSIEEFILDYLKRNNFNASKEALEAILKQAKDLNQVKNILDELICYKYNEKEITISDIKDLLEDPLEDNVYELCNAVIKRDSNRAYSIYSDLLKQNIQITYLLGLIITKFEEIYNNNVLVSYGYTQNDLAEINQVKLGRAYYMLQDAKNTSNKSLKRTLTKLNDLELGIKKGSLNPKVAFSSFLLGL